MSIEHIRDSLSVEELAHASVEYVDEMRSISAVKSALRQLAKQERPAAIASVRKLETIAEARYEAAVAQIVLRRAEAALS